jgi:hypothetical protein
MSYVIMIRISLLANYCGLLIRDNLSRIVYTGFRLRRITDASLHPTMSPRWNDKLILCLADTFLNNPWP